MVIVKDTQRLFPSCYTSDICEHSFRTPSGILKVSGSPKTILSDDKICSIVKAYSRSSQYAKVSTQTSREFVSRTICRQFLVSACSWTSAKRGKGRGCSKYDGKGKLKERLRNGGGGTDTRETSEYERYCRSAKFSTFGT